MNIQIRRATDDDLPRLLELCVGTINSTCKNDYSLEQLATWTSSVENEELWKERLANQYFLVATMDDKIVGLGSLENGDYLDFLYVHKDHLRQGVANKLFHGLEEEAARLGNTCITSDVSKTARSFFEKKGFKVVKEKKNINKEVEIINYKMIKEGISASRN